jgi:CheY-like chemotaxis protein
VGVASRPGHGSRFSVWLPYRAAACAAPEDQTAPGTTLIRCTPAQPVALVIEDDDRTADLIATQLRTEGFAVMHAATAEEGLVRAAKYRPQLITVDIFLPAMDGWELMRRLKADPKLADTPVVIISVSQDLDRGLAFGARRVLNKPFVHEELAAALTGLIEVRPDATPRVLVVEDNMKVAELLTTILEAEGYCVLRAYDGAEAIEAVRSARPDLVILDLMLPRVSGFEVARALRATQNTADIPMVVLSAKDLSSEEQEFLNGVECTIINKSSFKHEALLDEVRRALAKGTAD